MRVERVIIRALRALRARDDAFVGPDGTPYAAACLRGLNGSGKTTYLETVAALWQWFRRCTQKGRYVAPAQGPLVDAKFAGVLFSGLPGPRSRMWLAWGQASELKALPAGADNPYTIQGDRVSWDPEVLKFWNESITKAEAGVNQARQDQPPNVVFIEAERKYVPELRADELTRSIPPPAYVPVARYLAEARGPSHLEGLMRTLKLAFSDRWELLTRSVARLRPGLKLLDRFDEASQRPIFELATGEHLFVDRLSAGERSLLINLCMILRWLGPGGVVLLDEPELHQHVALMRGALSVLAAMIEDDFGGQLVVASHASEVWDYFRRSGALIDLDDDAGPP